MKAGFGEIWADLVATAERHAERQRRPVPEIAMLEPGLHALARYRLANALWLAGWRNLARFLAGWTRRATGFDLHPGARIGARCLLLAGGGVVVGEAVVIGDDCLIEPGVMLVTGGLAMPEADLAVLAGLPAGLGAQRSHPTVGRRVVLEAGALLVGDVFLGDDVRVLAGAVVTRDVPDGGIALGSPGRVLTRPQARPDPDARAIQALAERLYKLEEQVQIVSFAAQRQTGAHEPWRTRNPEAYGPIPAVEELIDGAGI